MDTLEKVSFRQNVEAFLKVNKSYWDKEPNILSGESWIYVLHVLHREFMTVTYEDLVAKGLQKKTNLPIVSVRVGKVGRWTKLADQLDESFGIEQRFHPSYHDYNSTEIEDLARKLASETYGKKDELLQLEYRNIKIGNALYDEIVRRGNFGRRGEVFDCFDISQEQYCRQIQNTLIEIDQAYEMFVERKPSYLIVTEPFYIRGLYAHVASVLDAKIIVTPPGTFDMMVQIDSDRHLLKDVTLSDIMRVRMRHYLQRDQANVENSEDFFAINSGVHKNRHTIEFPEIGKGKKNVFVLPHAFGDAPREVSRHTVYRDYHEWFLDTIRIIKDIPDVNWIIKDHPWASYYGQERYVRSVFERNKTDNMYWFDKKYSGMEIMDIADCVLTCGGSAGIEYWACGIPTVTTGDVYYCTWGISYQMKSLEEYENTLKNISRLKKPSAQSVAVAKKYLVACKNLREHDDTYTKLFYKFHVRQVSLTMKEGVYYGTDNFVDEQFDKIFSDFYESLVEHMQEASWKTSTIYQLKYLCDF